MKRYLPFLQAISLLSAVGITLQGCSINGAIREGNAEAIRYGKHLEAVVRDYRTVEKGFSDLRSLIDPDYYYDPEVSSEAPDRPLEDFRRIRDERALIEGKFRAYSDALRAVALKLDQISPPVPLNSFHEELRSRLIAKSEVWTDLPGVLDQILKDLSFEPGRALIEKDADLEDGKSGKLSDLIPGDLAYRNPWLLKASALSIHEPDGWWSTLGASAGIAYIGPAIVGGILSLPCLLLWYLAVVASRRTRVAIWPGVAANFAAVSIGAGCLGAGAAGLSVGLSEPGTVAPRWFPALLFLIGLLVWYGFIVREAVEFRRSLLDQLEWEWLDEEGAEQRAIQVQSQLVLAWLSGMVVGFAVFFWAYFAPDSLPQPWAWFYQR